MRRVLMVCTGNTCRSPMAEVLFRYIAEQKGIPVEVKSAGVAALAGCQMSKYAEEVLREKGLDTNGFQSQSLTEELVQWADIIFTMTSQHKRFVLEMFPAAVEKTFLLKEHAGSDPETTALMAEREALVAELQLRLALNQPIKESERKRLEELNRLLPEMDIMDPIGGSKQKYIETAQEIEKAAELILERLKNEQNG